MFFNHKMYATVFVQTLANSISSFLTILNKKAMIKIIQVFLQMNILYFSLNGKQVVSYFSAVLYNVPERKHFSGTCDALFHHRCT